MRILLVSDHYDPHLIGGTETHLQILARELAARGHAVSVVTARIGGEAERETRDGIPVLRIGRFPNFARTVWIASGTAPGVATDRIRNDFSRALEEVRPDVVHFHNVWMLGPELITLAGCRKGITIHDYWPVCPRRSMIRVDWSLCPRPTRIGCRICRLRAPTTLRSFNLCSIESERESFRRLIGGCDFVVAATRYVSGLLERILGIHADVISYGIPPEIPPMGGKSGPPFALFAGRVTKAKGYPLLQRAFSQPDLRGYTLLVAGRAKPSRLPNVKVLGWQPPEALFRWMAQAKCLALPSIWPEPAGIVILEALRAGIPVVASRIGGIPELVDDGVTGILVPPGDVPALTAAVRRCFEDRNLQASARRSGPEVIRTRFSLPQKIIQLEGVYAT
jgi:glycosyltransferase involved in cell wall biosynthesis